MPTTPVKNLFYRTALPFLAPSVKGKMESTVTGVLHFPQEAEMILARHHVLGSSLLLADGDTIARLDTSVSEPQHIAGKNTMYRVASITKTATACVALKLCEKELLALDAPVTRYLPETEHSHLLNKVTLRHILSHTSGLLPDEAPFIARGATWDEVIASPGAFIAEPGKSFHYCNFTFGLVGCMIEQVTGLCVAETFEKLLFAPLSMRATMDPKTLDEKDIMPISRVLPYRKGADVTITALGRKDASTPDPLRHFGFTAGGMYTDAPSLLTLLRMIARGGIHEGKSHLSPESIREMTGVQASYGAISPGMSYGFGLVMQQEGTLRILGHQGFAYGCVDGAFWQEGTDRYMIFLNGGCSEARKGRMGLCNMALAKWAFEKEIPAWTR